MSVLKSLSVLRGQKFRFTTILLFIVVIVAFVALRTGDRKQYLCFTEILDETVFTVDSEDVTLKEIAFYIAYEEQQVEKDAYVYNPDDTSEYWKLYSNGTFIGKAAKQSALDMAIHDKIFYDMACKEGMELDEEEQERLANSQYDFWSDLEEQQKEWLGVSQKDLNESLRKLALAEKCQSVYAKMNNCDMQEYSFEKELYQKILEEHEVIVNEDIWEYVHFGHITVHHKDK